MRVGILGTGRMGQTFGRRLVENGHEIFIGSRNPQKGKTIATSMGLNGNGGSNPKAAEFGEVLFVAWPWPAVHELIHTLGPLKDKILIDCTNPITGSESLQASSDQTPTWTEEFARSRPQTKIVKAFNTLSSNVLKNPTFDSRRATMFYCGDDKAAKTLVAKLASEIGFEPVDVGPLQMARHIESLAQFMVHLDIVSGKETEIALQLLRRRKASPSPKKEGFHVRQF